MASVREIAGELGVSATTVSRALNNRPGIDPETRGRVLEAVARSGYSRTVGLRTSRYIGYLHVLGHFVGNLGDYHAALLAGIVGGLRARHYDLAFVDLYHDKQPTESYTQFFRRKELRGVLMQVQPENRQLCEAIAAEGFPLVALAATFDDKSVNWAVCDTRAEVRSAVGHLAALVHRRIAAGVRCTLDHDHQARLAAFEESVAALGLDRDPQRVLRLEPTVDAGMSAVRQLMASALPPTAILFTNSQTTVGALRACHELGLSVPGDLSLVGFDDARVRFSTHPPFTAVCQDATALGRDAALWLARLVDGEVAGPLQLRLQGTFEVHGTTGPRKTR